MAHKLTILDRGDIHTGWCECGRDFGDHFTTEGVREVHAEHLLYVIERQERLAKLSQENAHAQDARINDLEAAVARLNRRVVDLKADLATGRNAG